MKLADAEVHVHDEDGPEVATYPDYRGRITIHTTCTCGSFIRSREDCLF